MSTNNQAREPKGVSTGGRWRATKRSEGNVHLSSQPVDTWKAVHEGTFLDREGQFRLLSEHPELLDHEDPEARAAIAKWGEDAMLEENWRKLANDRAPLVRAAVVAHAARSIWVYGGVHDADSAVRMAAAESELASPAWLAQLSEDPDATVAEKAKANANYRAEGPRHAE